MQSEYNTSEPHSVPRRLFALLVGALGIATLLVAPIEAQRGGRGGGGRSMARSSVHRGNAGASHGVNRAGNMNRGANVNRSANINHNVNQNVNVNRNVNVHHDVHVYGGGYYNSWGYPLATAAAVTATAVTVGAIVASLPPDCSPVVSNGVTYQNCGGTMYQPVQQGNNVQYVVVKKEE